MLLSFLDHWVDELRCNFNQTIFVQSYYDKLVVLLFHGLLVALAISSFVLNDVIFVEL